MLRSQVRRSNVTIQIAILNKKGKSKNDEVTNYKQEERHSKMEKSKTLASRWDLLEVRIWRGQTTGSNKKPATSKERRDPARHREWSPGEQMSRKRWPTGACSIHPPTLSTNAVAKWLESRVVEGVNRECKWGCWGQPWGGEILINTEHGVRYLSSLLGYSTNQGWNCA